MRAINVLLAILVSLAIGLGVFEVGLRILGFGPPKTLNQFDASVGWVKRPDARIGKHTNEFDITIETNEHGLRDDAGVGPEEPAGKTRVMMLGDSFVLGYTVDRKDLFVDQLENWWKAEGRSIDVINAGTEGYSTDQEALWFQEVGAKYRPDLVLLFAYENDLFWCGEKRYQRFPKPLFSSDGKLESGKLVDPGPASVSERSAILRFLALQRARFARKGPPAFFQPAGSSSWIFSEFAPVLRTPPTFVADGVARAEGALLALQASCQAAGAKLVLVAIPSESAIEPAEREKFRTSSQGLGGLSDDRWDPNLPVETYLALARELGIEALDPRPALLAAAKTEKLYFDSEWHFNPAGNESFAGFLHDELDARSLVPAAPRAGSMPLVAHEEPTPRWPYVYAALWLVLGSAFVITYRGKESPVRGFLGVGLMLALVFAIVLGGGVLIGGIPPKFATGAVLGFVVLLLGFVAYKLGRRLATILELLRSFTLRGHWYLMPLVVVLLSIGSLLVVAASSPLIAPFIYTLF